MGVTAQDYLNVWRSWIGFSEANGKFKQIIDLYNSMKPLPRGYAVRYTDEWCDTTVSAAAIKAGCVNLVGRECGCEEHVKIFKSMEFGLKTAQLFRSLVTSFSLIGAAAYNLIMVIQTTLELWNLFLTEKLQQLRVTKEKQLHVECCL